VCKVVLMVGFHYFEHLYKVGSLSTELERGSDPAMQVGAYLGNVQVALPLVSRRVPTTPMY